MNWYKRANNEFEYSRQIYDFWRKLIRDTQRKVGISFDLENDDNIGEIKKIKIDGIKYLNNEPYYILAELCHAGGDWQNEVAYFRCQPMAGKTYEDKFVFIPSKEQGNNYLVETTNKDSDYNWVVSCENNINKEEVKIDDKQCWKALKEYTLKYLSEQCPVCEKE